MKHACYIALLLLFAASSACKKDDGASPQEVERSWSYAGATLRAAFADVNTRGGYHITFRPEGATGLEYGITFRFAERPAAGMYTVTPGSPGSEQVNITLENGAANTYLPVSGNQQTVRVSLSQSKFSLTGDEIRMVRSTGLTGPDSLTLSFRLTEF